MAVNAKRGVARWYHGWNIIGICILVQAGSLGVPINCMTFFLEDWSREFDLPISQLVIAVPLFATVAALVQPFIGALAARYPARRILMGAIMLTGTAQIVMSFVGSGWQILLLYATLLPLATGFAGSTPTQTLVSRWFVRRRGFAFSLAAMGLVIGGVAFPPIVVRLMDAFGWRMTWVVFGCGILTLVLGLAWLLIREYPEAEEGQSYVIPEPPQPAGTDSSIVGIMKRLNFWIVLGVFSPILLANSALGTNFAPYLADKGIGLSQAALLIGAYNAAAVLGKIVIGLVSDRFGNRISLVIMASCAVASMFGLLVADSVWMFLLCFVGLGAGQGVWVLLVACCAEEYGTPGLPQALGIMSAFTLFSAFGSPVVARVEEATGSYDISVLVLALCTLAALVAAFLYKPRLALSDRHEAMPEAAIAAAEQVAPTVPSRLP